MHLFHIGDVCACRFSYKKRSCLLRFCYQSKPFASAPSGWRQAIKITYFPPCLRFFATAERASAAHNKRRCGEAVKNIVKPSGRLCLSPPCLSFFLPLPRRVPLSTLQLLHFPASIYNNYTARRCRCCRCRLVTQGIYLSIGGRSSPIAVLSLFVPLSPSLPLSAA